MDSILQKREAQLLSKILYKIHSIEDNVTMRQTVLELIPNMIHCSRASFYLGSDDEDRFMDRPVGYNMDSRLLEDYYRYDKYDHMNGIFINSETEVYRETDYFIDEPNDMYYSAQVSLYYSEILLGVVTLFRGKEDSDFSDHDLFLLTLIKDHLALRLYRDYMKNETKSSPSFLQKYVHTYNLTARETEVVRLIFEGLTNDEMADELSISHFTIQKHISNIYRKLGINSKSQLFRLEAEKNNS